VPVRFPKFLLPQLLPLRGCWALALGPLPHRFPQQPPGKGSETAQGPNTKPVTGIYSCRSLLHLGTSAQLQRSDGQLPATASLPPPREKVGNPAPAREKPEMEALGACVIASARLGAVGGAGLKSPLCRTAARYGAGDLTRRVLAKICNPRERAVPGLGSRSRWPRGAPVPPPRLPPSPGDTGTPGRVNPTAGRFRTRWKGISPGMGPCPEPQGWEPPRWDRAGAAGGLCGAEQTPRCEQGPASGGEQGCSP